MNPGLLKYKSMYLQSESAYLDIESKAIELAAEIGAEYWAVSSLSGKHRSYLKVQYYHAFLRR